MKGGIGTFKELLTDENEPKTRSEKLKIKLKKERELQEYQDIRDDVILKQMRAGGIDRIKYLRSQLDYFKFFAYSSEAKADNIVYQYRQKMKSEIQWVMISNIHTPILGGGLIYALTRQLKSGYTTAAISGTCVGLFILSSFHNTHANRAFEIAYPAHPLVIQRRKQTIEK